MVLEKVFCFAVLAASLISNANAELSGEEKQAIFDLHNYYRAVLARNQMVWQNSLAEDAQTIAENCDLEDFTLPEDADAILYYSIAAPPAALAQRFDPQQFQQNFDFNATESEVLNWPGTTSIGCGHELCGQLFVSSSSRSPSPMELYVCLLSPPRIAETTPPPAHCGADSDCPPSWLCTDFVSTILMPTFIPGKYCALSRDPLLVPVVGNDSVTVIRELYMVEPRDGSIAGGTRLILGGTGFGDGFDEHNEVYLVYGNSRLPCDILELHVPTSTLIITCDTRPVPLSEVGVLFQVEVIVTDADNLQHILTCSSCVFMYVEFRTPFLEGLKPLDLTCGQTLTLSGQFRAESLGDPDDPPDDLNKDFFTRLLTGDLCDHYDENRQEYPASLDDNGVTASITCLPQSCQVRSANVTAVLAYAGKSFVAHKDYTVTLDNHLQPYHIQFHADIVEVYPEAGSPAGGTTIFVTLSGQLAGYLPEDIRVFAGGTPCINVTLDTISSTNRTWSVGCITGPAPPPADYYPGERGVLREYFSDPDYCKELVRGGVLATNRTRSEYQVVHERLYRHHKVTPADFGEVSHFCEIFSGYFVPPVTNLYTFNILSDGWSQLHFRVNSSQESLIRIAYADSGTNESWNHNLTQIAAPLLLEAHTPYYFEFLATHKYGNWSAGMGAKFNDSFMDYPYEVDHEQQVINISSTVIKEQHVVFMSIVPQVYTLQLLLHDSSALNHSTLTCHPFNLILRQGSESVAIPFTLHRNINQIEIHNLLHDYTQAFPDMPLGSFQAQIIRLMEHEIEFVFAFVANVSLQLENESLEVQCWESVYNSTFLAEVSIVMIQTLRHMDTFSLTLDGHRFTPYLPLNVSTERMEQALTDLISWQCTREMSGVVWMNDSFDERRELNETGTDPLPPTPFCGRGARHNPQTVWEMTEPRHFTSLYVCFTYRGYFPGLKAEFTLQFQSGQQRNLDVTVYLQNSPDRWTDYMCVDIGSKVEQEVEPYLTCTNPGCNYVTAMRRLMFYKQQFWIDELYIATGRGDVSRIASESPSYPNGIEIAHIGVYDGPYPFPRLLRIGEGGFAPGFGSRYGSKLGSTNGFELGSGSGFNFSYDSGPFGSGFEDSEDSPSDLERLFDHFGVESATDHGYILAISHYHVVYTVRDCAVGLPVITSYFQTPPSPHPTPTYSIRVFTASGPVAGTFSISLGGRTLTVPADIDETRLKCLLQEYPGELEVSRSGTCAGYHWLVDWTGVGGDIPKLTVNGSQLLGVEARVHVFTPRDGGTWLRPLRGAMLRTPEPVPQVEVIVDGIPSSCHGYNCSFLFLDSLAPNITSLSPSSGRSNTTLLIQWSGYDANSFARVWVKIGHTPCKVMSVNESEIVCVTGKHTAGTYEVEVMVEGVGVALDPYDVACFTYTLMVSSITPSTAGASGGYLLDLTGEGFIEFVNVASEILLAPELASLPLFQYGLGIPYIGHAHELGLCGGLEDVFADRMDNASSCFRGFVDGGFMSASCPLCSHRHLCEEMQLHWGDLLNAFPSVVLVGQSPCIITEADIDYIQCMALPTALGEVNITVVVFDENDTLTGSFTTLEALTPIVDEVTPDSGVVVGDTEVTITGSGFNSSNLPVRVNIGFTPCHVTSVNDTHVSCTTGPHPPTFGVPVIMVVEYGIAVRNISGNVSQGDLLYHIFRYQLVMELVDGVSVGSVRGGSQVSITGGIFVPGRTSVFVGHNAAEVVSVESDMITMTIPSAKNTRSIHLTITPTGDGDFCFFLSEDYTHVFVGDTVTWQWGVVSEVPAPYVFLEITGGNVSQYISCEPDNCKHTFEQAGTHHISMEIFLQYEHEIIEGTVQVNPIALTPTLIHVFVDHFQAIINPSTLFNLSMPNNSSSSSVGGRRDVHTAADLRILDLSLCEDDFLSSLPDPFFFFLFPHFLYSPCATPLLFYVLPSQAPRLGTVFVVWGHLFANSSEGVRVWFGEHECEVMNSTTSELSCMFNDTASLPPSLTPLPVEVLVLEENRGLALVSHQDHHHHTDVTFLPVIHSVSPSAGSVEGGTDVLITGDGFLFPSDLENELLGYLHDVIDLGKFPCDVMERSYSWVWCRTLAGQSGEVFNLAFHLNGEPLVTVCSSEENCTYTFSDNLTPNVTSVTPTLIGGADYSDPTTLEMMGSGFSESTEDNLVFVGGHQCLVLNSTHNNITCSLPALPASDYPLTLTIYNQAEGKSIGLAQIAEGFQTITSQGAVVGVSPTQGSVLGGTEITIFGFGFHTDMVVYIGDYPCLVSDISITSIVCVTTPPSNGAGLGLIQVTFTGYYQAYFLGEVWFEFSLNSTPIVTGVSPPEGRGGDTVVIWGTGFGQSPSNETTSIEIGSTVCVLVPEASNDTALMCVLTTNVVGNYPVSILVFPSGYADSANVSFQYQLFLSGVEPSIGSFAGMSTVTVSGTGFDPSNAKVTICGRICYHTHTPRSRTEIECTVPSAANMFSEGGGDLSCDVVVTTFNAEEEVFYEEIIPHGYTYVEDLTPQVTGISRERGGTGGGTPVIVHGFGFGNNASVFIGRSECNVMNQTNESIWCVTGLSSRTQRATVHVLVDGMHALSDVQFWYVDVWSSPFTWGGGPLPVDGDFVVIERTQSVLLDMHTPLLSFLLIQGELVFDDEAGDDQVSLSTEGALITSGGRLVVGTEDKPFLSRTVIEVHGHALSTELPIYGSKSIGLREGVIDMHGRPLNVTWTRLAQTALPGDTELHLQDWVDWEVGGKIVLASTSFSQRENEELTLDSVEGNVLRLVEEVQYEHISVQQTIAGRFVDTSAEVGYLTRNIVVRGSTNESSLEEVPECAQEFNPGQFARQTCFRGRFGAESISEQFGVQIFIHAPRMNEDLVTSRIEFVEVTDAGQAFRLGRYPIHFHLNGNVSGSYVRGCALHHTFNRAVTIHSVDHLLVERNVAYDVLGHAYFLEDGNERFNKIQDNLGVFVRASSSLLNVDITPGTFWIVNPDNIVRRNAAAGGTHFGFWYRLPAHPTGPSVDPNMCPRKMLVAEFSGNTAHSFGWYGLWVFRHYFPSPSGECGDNRHAPAIFDNFIAWRSDRGVEFGEVGSVRLTNSMVLDNKLAGVELVVLTAVWGEDGPEISDTVVVGYSNITTNDTFCTQAGIKTPHSYYLTVSSVTFVNFDRAGCFPVLACSQCSNLEGGFETRYRDISFVNAGSSLTCWQWKHEHVHYDMDGTLTGTGQAQLLVPTSDLLDADACEAHPESSSNGNDCIQGSICSDDMRFGRLGIFGPRPRTLDTSALTLANEHGEEPVPFATHRIIGPPGYMALLPLNTNYYLTWEAGQTLTNISYFLVVSGFEQEDYIIVSQTYPRPLDVISIGGVTVERNISALDDPANVFTGDFALINSTTIQYVLKGDFPPRILQFVTYRCFYDNCESPSPPAPTPTTPLGRPENVTLLMWSDPEIWAGGEVPGFGDDVILNGTDMYVLLNLLNVTVGRLEIRDGATLEVLDNGDHVITADLILIVGGRFVAGYPEEPFTSHLTIALTGDLTTPEFRFDPFTPTVGAKAVGVFGDLVLHAARKYVPWTQLAETVVNGSTFLWLVDPVDWESGQHVVITSTSFDAYETEVMEVLSVLDGGYLVVLNGVLQHTHLGAPGDEWSSIRAEVGLLSRNILITNADPLTSYTEAYGCRVLVSTHSINVGAVLLDGVEFSGCGQLGFTEDYDSRFALALVGLGDGARPSYVRGCSFHDSYNTAVGVFDTHGVQLDDNVIHSTVGPSLIANGRGHSMTRNLASLSHFIGTYRGRDDVLDRNWRANYELTGVTELNFTLNHAAGGDKACFHLLGEECAEGGDSSMIRDNVGHSALHCLHLGYWDNKPSGCARFTSFLLYSCQRYGVFSYTPLSVEVWHSVLINNWVGVYVSVIGPSARSHVVGDKYVHLEDLIVAATANSSTRCQEEEFSLPDLAMQMASKAGIQTPTGGRVGVVIPSFVSGPGHFPTADWHSIISYPALAGLTVIRDVTFVNFEENCGHKDAAIMTNPRSEDANHPVCLEGIQHVSNSGEIDRDRFLHVHEPNVGSVNPSDCVDMDCDGFKQLVLKDLDGFFTGADGPRTLVSVAEFEWDMDPQRGLGDFRIPRTMLTDLDGTRLNPNSLYPTKGIVRGSEGFGDESDCEFQTAWNMYVCSELRHTMLVVESLDADTETRRLSPVGLAANGFINLLNGPMDNGWCGGYTCQERISTFYGIVAMGLTYVLAFTSTNPQELALHLLDSDSDYDLGIILALIYTSPQRLDVYVIEEDGEVRYIVPKNATLLPSNDLQYARPDPSDPDALIPTFSDEHGANHYDRTSKRLYIRLANSRTVIVATSLRILVSFNLTVSEEGFFDEEVLVENIATLLGIPPEKVKVVDVVAETGARRRRQSSGKMTAIIEISDGPSRRGRRSDDDDDDDEESSLSDNDSEDVFLTFEDLLELLNILIEAIQSEIEAFLDGMSGVVIVGVFVTEPTPPPVDPTNGTLATPETGGPQPGDNGTEFILTYYQTQLQEELEADNQSDSGGGFSLSLPSVLSVEEIPDDDDIIEGVALTSGELVVVMLDINGEVASTLGVLGTPWVLTAELYEGPEEAFLTWMSANLTEGVADFEGLVFSHLGDYVLYFTVSYPSEASFYLVVSLSVAERELALSVLSQPQDGNDTFALYPYPTVELVDPEDEDLRVTDHTWRNSSWYVVAYVSGDDNYLDCAELANGVAIFTNILVTTAGEYQLEFEALEYECDGEELSIELITSDTFEVTQLSFTRLLITYAGLDYHEVIGEEEEEFHEIFKREFESAYDSLEAFNITSSEGSIVVSVFVTSQDVDDLIAVVEEITSEDSASSFSFTFGDTLFVPSSVEQDPDYPLEKSEDSTHHSKLVYVLPVLSGLFLAGISVSVVVAAYRYYKKKQNHRIGTLLVDQVKYSYEYEMSEDDFLPPPYESRPPTGTRTPAPPYESRPPSGSSGMRLLCPANSVSEDMSFSAGTQPHTHSSRKRSLSPDDPLSETHSSRRRSLSPGDPLSEASGSHPHPRRRSLSPGDPLSEDTQPRPHSSRRRSSSSYVDPFAPRRSVDKCSPLPPVLSRAHKLSVGEASLSGVPLVFRNDSVADGDSEEEGEEKQTTGMEAPQEERTMSARVAWTSHGGHTHMDH